MADEQTPGLAEAGRDFGSETRIVSELLAKLQDFSPEGREHILRTVATFYGVSTNGPGQRGERMASAIAPIAAFSEDRSPTPKQFMLEKRPITDIERVTALGYYLMHYRNQPHFKTLDLSQLNTEAAQIKLSNPAQAVENAIRAGLISQATKGARQVTATGELYVQALPDRDAARAAIKHVRPRRRSKRSQSSNVGESDES